jgi:hypothetical protein
MNARMWGRGLVAVVAVATVAAGSPAAADDADRLTGDDPAHAAAQPGDVASAGTIVALPDLGITHRLPDGGMNLWRMPLSELETGYGQPQLVKTLNFGGFSYDNSRTLAGDVGDITASDDGTADHIIWHAQPNGGVLLWAVGGGSDPTPRLWQDLRTGGWSYADSQPLIGDVTGDGWDDLVVVHRNGVYDNIWVFRSNGLSLGPPEYWQQTRHQANPRYSLADLYGNGHSVLLSVNEVYFYGQSIEYATLDLAPGWDDSWRHSQFMPVGGRGWSCSQSRQIAGDVTGDGRADLVTVHAQSGGGMLVWVHPACANVAHICFDRPVVWQDLRTGGWSFAGSRQHLADTNGDDIVDLVSVHSQSGNPGLLLWRHLSTGAGLLAPQVVADLRAGGWSYTASRETVADLYGEI